MIYGEDHMMQSTKDEDFMLLAIEEAEAAKNVGDWPFGAVVECNGIIVGRGRATDKTTGDVTDHAEIMAIRSACRELGTNNLKDCTIYCTNEPCLMCAAGIFQANIPRVVIGVSRDDLSHLLRKRNLAIEHLAHDSGYEIQIVRGILKEKILDLFSDIRNPFTAA